MRMRMSLEVSRGWPPATRPFAFTMSAGSFMPGGTHARTQRAVVPGGRDGAACEMHRGAGLVGNELIALEVDAPAFRLADMEPGGAGEIAEMRAVPGRDLAQILRADQAGGAVLVLHHDVRVRVDVLDQMLGEDAALDVGRPAGRKVDHHGQPLALVERLLGGGGQNPEYDGSKPEQQRTTRAHGL